MVLENLSNSLKTTIKKVLNAPYVDKKLIKEICVEVQRALLQADVNVKQVLELTKEIERRGLTEKPAGMGSGEHVVRMLYEELSKILGKGRTLELKKQRILLLGIYGQGKTTTCAKIARFLQKKGLKVGLIAADIHRPAAYDQLKQLGEQINVKVFGGEYTNAIRLVKDGLKELGDCDVVLIDTAGRHKLDNELMKEIKKIEKIAKPEEKLLVVDATIGQQAKTQAKAFNDAVALTGVVLTKMDGGAKGGGALSAVSEVGSPVLFIGTGEKIEDLEQFDSERFISRLLGMGDLQTLLEKAKESLDETKSGELARKMLSGKFTLREFYEEIESVSKIGTMDKIVGMLPTQNVKIDKNKIEEGQAMFSRFKIIMDSMTGQEMDNPSIIKGTRIQRVAMGSGFETKDVRQLLKYYNMSKNMVKGLKNKKTMRRMMSRMGMGS